MTTSLHQASNRFAEKFKPKPDLTKPNRFKTERSNADRSKSSRSTESRQYPPRRVLRFDLSGFTPKGKTAITSVIDKVREYSPNLRVKAVKNGKVQSQHLIDLVNELDPESQGIQLVSTGANGNNVVVKKVKLIEMIEQYNNELARQVEEQLIEAGNTTALKAADYRVKAERKKSAAKNVSLKWTISLGDLRLQKKLEILKQVDRAKPFQLQLSTKQTHQIVNADGELVDYTPHLEQFEIKRRELILGEVELILEESGTTFDRHGSIYKQVFYNCVPKEKPKVSNKNDKKLKQAEKQRQRQEQAKAKKMEEEDLDSLYLFKVDD